MTEVHAVLEAAADLIAKPDGWTQHCDARDADGRGVPALRFDAACFCAIGAVQLAAGGQNDVYYDACAVAATAAGKPLYGRSGGPAALFLWNDTPGRTQKEVVKALRKGAKLAKAARTEERLTSIEAKLDAIARVAA